MANEEHLAILEQGVEVWNQWREENPEMRPDPSGVNLSGLSLPRANLYEANLDEAHLSGAFLHEANLRKAYLRQAHLYKAFERLLRDLKASTN